MAGYSRLIDGRNDHLGSDDHPARDWYSVPPDSRGPGVDLPRPDCQDGDYQFQGRRVGVLPFVGRLVAKRSDLAVGPFVLSKNCARSDLAQFAGSDPTMLINW